MLFLTPEMRASNKVDNAAIMDEAPTTKGTRTSARQRAKHHKLLLIEREKELARQQAGKPRTMVDSIYCAVQTFNLDCDELNMLFFLVK
jgi:hypothetical protein